VPTWPTNLHYNRYNHFRRPETAENKPFAAENKTLFSAARAWPPKIAYFRRLPVWPPKITDYLRRLYRQPPEIKNAENKILIFGGQEGPPKITNFRAKKIEKSEK
jgi:hypothetical protein